jgi:hypothetical protein
VSTSAPHVQPRPDIVFSRVSDAEGILLSVTSKRYYSLNETGMVIWEALQRGVDPDGAAAALEAEFEVTPEEASAVVAEFLRSLLEENLVHAADPAAG